MGKMLYHSQDEFLSVRLLCSLIEKNLHSTSITREKKKNKNKEEVNHPKALSRPLSLSFIEPLKLASCIKDVHGQTDK